LEKVFLIHGRTKEEFLSQAVDALLAEGFTVGMPSHWEKSAALRQRLGVTERTWARKLASRFLSRVLPPADIERGPTGRIIQIRSNEEFEKWVAPPSCQKSEDHATFTPPK
jgi:hypothetical protein